MVSALKSIKNEDLDLLIEVLEKRCTKRKLKTKDVNAVEHLLRSLSEGSFISSFWPDSREQRHIWVQGSRS